MLSPEEPIRLNWSPAPPNPLRGGELHIWRVDLDLPGLDEVSRPELLVNRRDVGSRALREVLAGYLGCELAAVELTAGEHGKPRLAGDGPRFNVTNTGGLMLVALHEQREVGIDAEAVDSDRDVVALARIGLPQEQAKAVAAAPRAQRSDLFHALWTRHEALVKCHGTGLAEAIPTRPIWLVSLMIEPGATAAVAVAGDEPPAAIVGWSLDQVSRGA